MVQRTTIIPIAGGKGGVGKTFLTANLAVALAERGEPTIAVDLDLGNSNLHSFLGLENRYTGIGEFLRGAVKCSPEELVVQTKVKGLGFVAGDGRMPFMANITYNQKRTLLKILKQLPARYLLLDLSAGTSFNTLDLFLSSDSGILVTTPEHPAIMNALVFVRNALLRALEQGLRGDDMVTEKLNEFYKQGANDPILTIESFRRDIARENPEAAAKITRICNRIRPRFVYNMVESLQDTEIFGRIDQTLAKLMGLECDHIGMIPYDASVRRLLRQPEIFLSQDPSSRTSKAIREIADGIISSWDIALKNSDEKLEKYARSVLAGSESQGEANGR